MGGEYIDLTGICRHHAAIIRKRASVKPEIPNHPLIEEGPESSWRPQPDAMDERVWEQNLPHADCLAEWLQRVWGIEQVQRGPFPSGQQMGRLEDAQNAGEDLSPDRSAAWRGLCQRFSSYLMHQPTHQPRRAAAHHQR